MDRLTIQLDDGNYMPRQLCTVDRFGGVDDCDGCSEYCLNDCNKCAIQECFNKLAHYEDLAEQNKMPVNKDGMVTVKMWFKNGVYIGKKVDIKKMSTEEVEEFVSVIAEVPRTVKDCFVNNIDAQITVQGMTVRVSELIAIDFDITSEEEPEEEKAEEDM